MLWSESPWQPFLTGQTTSLAASTSGIAKKNKRSLRLAFFHSLVRLPVSRYKACQLGGRASSCGQRHQANTEPLGGAEEDEGWSMGDEPGGLVPPRSGPALLQRPQHSHLSTKLAQPTDIP